jgi:hypothetical protein
VREGCAKERRFNMGLMPEKFGNNLAGCLSFPSLFAMAIIWVAVIRPTLQQTSLWFWFGVAMVFAVVGIVLLAYARFPLYRQRRFFEFGLGAIPEDRKKAYWWAWRFALVAIIIQLILIGITTARNS